MAIKQELTSETFLTQRVNLVLLAFNAIGAVVYVVRASPSWAIPQEHGMVPITGEPFVWAVGFLPVLAIFSLLNLTWGALILRYRQWRSGRYWLLIAPIWLVAVLIDFSHH
jgi:hypothetical protein